ncbi:uncharacterized protein B0H18DRAFT_1020564, partial [Fomitopsis serialis]|uniref:uncharacterized protein n=1 Tax=Fomitopsis serialis TaxID=139415 RepID=UPI002007283C
MAERSIPSSGRRYVQTTATAAHPKPEPYAPASPGSTQLGLDLRLPPRATTNGNSETITPRASSRNGHDQIPPGLPTNHLSGSTASDTSARFPEPV